MTHSFRWLHLTDLHWGDRTELKNEWAIIEDKLRADFQTLKNAEKLGGPIDAVFFTGDLVNFGEKDEFDALTPKLSKLLENLNSDDSLPWFFAIPGNHDLKRPPLDDDGLRHLSRYFEDKKVRDNVWKKKHSTEYKTIENAFQNYVQWWKDLKGPFRKPEEFLYGYFPGDLIATLACRDFKIGVIGLNTAAIQLAAGSYEGKIQIRTEQMSLPLNGDYTDWMREHDSCFLLTHHPPDWYCEASKKAYTGFIYQKSHFCAHLCGHVHEPKVHYQQMQSADQDGPKWITALSLFGREERFEIEKEKVKKSIQRQFGYQAGKLEILNGQAEVRIWPRRIRQLKSNNQWFVGPDPEFENESLLIGRFNVQKREKSSPNKPMKEPSRQFMAGQGRIEEQSTFRQVLSDGIRSLLAKPHLNAFCDFAMADLGESIELTQHLVQDLDLIESLDFLTRTCRAFFENLSSGNLDKVLMDLEVLAGWLSLLSLKEEWEPKLCEDDQEFSGIDFYIPVRHFPSVEIVISKIRINPARFTFEATNTTTFRGENQIEYPDPSECGPECTDMVNHIKAVLWCKMSPKQEAMVIETLPDGRKRAKRFAPWMNERLIEKFFSTKSKEWRPTPYLLLNPSREGSLQISQDVLSQLRKDLAPLQIICLTQEEDIWKEGLNEEKVLEELESFFDVLQEAYDKLKG